MVKRRRKSPNSSIDRAIKSLLARVGAGGSTITISEEVSIVNAANSWEKTKRVLQGNDEGAALFGTEEGDES